RAAAPRRHCTPCGSDWYPSTRPHRTERFNGEPLRGRGFHLWRRIPRPATRSTMGRNGTVAPPRRRTSGRGWAAVTPGHRRSPPPRAGTPDTGPELQVPPLPGGATVPRPAGRPAGTTCRWAVERGVRRRPGTGPRPASLVRSLSGARIRHRTYATAPPGWAGRHAVPEPVTGSLRRRSDRDGGAAVNRPPARGLRDSGARLGAVSGVVDGATNAPGRRHQPPDHGRDRHRRAREGPGRRARRGVRHRPVPAEVHLAAERPQRVVGPGGVLSTHRLSPGIGRDANARTPSEPARRAAGGDHPRRVNCRDTTSRRPASGRVHPAWVSPGATGTGHPRDGCRAEGERMASRPALDAARL